MDESFLHAVANQAAIERARLQAEADAAPRVESMDSAPSLYLSAFRNARAALLDAQVPPNSTRPSLKKGVFRSKVIAAPGWEFWTGSGTDQKNYWIPADEILDNWVNPDRYLRLDWGTWRVSEGQLFHDWTAMDAEGSWHLATVLATGVGSLIARHRFEQP